MHAMDIMRMESGFLHWGHDISPEENQYQAGLSFTINYEKDTDFIGRKALEKIQKEKIKSRLVMLTLKDSKPGAPLLLHDEPIYINNDIIGRTTSGNYSFNYKKNLSFGYIETDYSNVELTKMDLYIEVDKQKYPVIVNNIMNKGIFYNQRYITENSETKKVSTVSYVSKKNKVDINKLLNRVKIEKKNQNKKKILSLSLGILLITLMGIFISVIK